MYVALVMTTKEFGADDFQRSRCNTTPHCALFEFATHTTFLTCVGSRTATVQDVRVSLDSFIVVSLQLISHHFCVVSCRARSRNFLTYFLAHLRALVPPSCPPLTEITTVKTIHIQERSLADWLNNPLLVKRERQWNGLLTGTL